MIRESGVASCSCGRAGRALLLYLNYLQSHLYCTDNVCETAYRRLLCFWGRGGGDRGPCIRPISRLAVRAFSLFLFPPSLLSLASSSFLRMESRFMITAYLRCMYSGHNGSAPRQTGWSYHLPDRCVKRFFSWAKKQRNTRVHGALSWLRKPYCPAGGGREG